MRRLRFLFFALLIFLPVISPAAELPKIAVWDLAPRNISADYAVQLTSILVSEISKLDKYETYSQDNVRTLAGWTAERMQLGCSDTKCLTALGQMDIAKLISGNVGKIGNRYTISLSLFDTQNARSERAISEFCQSEDELIDLVQMAVRKLLGIEVAPSKAEGKEPEKAATGVTSPLTGRPITDPVTGMEFVFLKGGCFQMGDTFGDGDKEERPVHDVCLNDFYFGRNEVRVGDFRKFVNETGYRTEAESGDGCFTYRGDKWEKDRNANWRKPGFAIDDRHSVVCVSWNDSMAFIDWLKRKTGKQFRLPTEAEWEYAARSGGKREKWSGTSSEGELGQYAWHMGNSGSRMHAVGEKRPNGLGLYDMSGNVWEWCSDWYGENYYQSSARNNPEGAGNGSFRVIRGGSWYGNPRVVRAAYRNGFDPTSQSNGCGFRLGLSAR